MHDEASNFVSVPEFAARTSLSARHVWRLVREHKIPSHLIGRRRIIPLGPALDALLDAERPAERLYPVEAPTGTARGGGEDQ